MNSEYLCIYLIYAAVVLALLWAAINAWAVLSVDVLENKNTKTETEQLIDNTQIEQV